MDDHQRALSASEQQRGESERIAAARQTRMAELEAELAALLAERHALAERLTALARRWNPLEIRRETAGLGRSLADSTKPE